MAIAPMGAAFANKGDTGALAISAQNTFTTSSFHVPAFKGLECSVWGSFVGTTVTLQRRRDDEDDSTGWHDVPYLVNPATGAITNITAATEFTVPHNRAGMFYRIGVKTGDYAAGPVNVRLSWN